jgi:hypothetical protein
MQKVSFLGWIPVTLGLNLRADARRPASELKTQNHLIAHDKSAYAGNERRL